MAIKKTLKQRKTQVIRFRVTEEELERIRKQAEKQNFKSVSAYCRVCITKTDSLHLGFLQRDLRNLKKQMSRIGNNLNQIARYFHMGGVRSRAMEENINACIGAIMDIRSQVVKMAGEFHGNTEASNE